jgi:hypothetical protein
MAAAWPPHGRRTVAARSPHAAARRRRTPPHRLCARIDRRAALARILAGRYNRIIGPVRLRQLRTKPDTCTVPPMFVHLIDECYAPYFILTQDESPYGPAEEPTLWQYSTSGDLDGQLAAGRFATYSGGGYVVDLPTNASHARGIVEGLKQNGWVDRATRAVFVDFACYNANTEAFVSVRQGLHTRRRHRIRIRHYHRHRTRACTCTPPPHTRLHLHTATAHAYASAPAHRLRHR